MVKRFQSRLIDPIAWKLLFKSAFVALALFLLVKFNFSAFAVLFSLGSTLFIYFSEFPEIAATKTSFWLITFSAFIALKTAEPASDFIFYAELLFFLILFWTLLQLANFHFKDRFFVYGIFNSAVLIQVALVFFYFAKPDFFIMPGIILFFSLMFLWRETFKFFGASERKKNFVISIALSLISLELALLIIFLPLGFINAAALLVLFLVLSRDAILYHREGRLNFDFVFRELTLLVVITIIVFVASGWGI